MKKKPMIIMDKKNWKLSKFGVVILFFLLIYHNLIICFSLRDEEGLALLKFRNGIQSDPFGALKNWSVNDDHCSWFGVECSDGRVVNLNLKDLCLGGTLAPDLRNLVHIKSIILRNNSFYGTIPQGIGELKELKMLDLGYNNVSGPLPTYLVDSSLTVLLLDNNRNLLPGIDQLKMLPEVENDLSCAAELTSCKNIAETEYTVTRREMQEVSPPRPQENESPYLRGHSQSTPAPHGPGNVTPTFVPSPPNSTVNGSFPRDPNSPSSSTLSPANGKPSSSTAAIIAGAVGGSLLLVVAIAFIYLCTIHKTTVKPWATGLSGQLQKAFINGVPKLKRSELEAGCEDFSNVIGSSPIGTMYKGTLSSGVEIAVASVAAISSGKWSRNLEAQFRKKIETLSKVNHKNFINLIGYCEEKQPFTRMLVFEYAPNGTLFEHLHFKESEHINWAMRLRIAMGTAYYLEHMHQLNPPLSHNNLNSSAVFLAEDYAAKVSDFSFSTGMDMEGSSKFLDVPTANPESNVYSFGVLLFEMMTGRLPYSVDNSSHENWASDYLRAVEPLKDMVDPTLKFFEEEKLEKIGEVIKSCVHPDPKKRPVMLEVTATLREITGMAPNATTPKFSPLWWAELEIASMEAS